MQKRSDWNDRRGTAKLQGAQRGFGLPAKTVMVGRLFAVNQQAVGRFCLH
jgi:hypothetical protein